MRNKNSKRNDKLANYLSIACGRKIVNLSEKELLNIFIKIMKGILFIFLPFMLSLILDDGFSFYFFAKYVFIVSGTMSMISFIDSIKISIKGIVPLSNRFSTWVLLFNFLLCVLMTFILYLGSQCSPLSDRINIPLVISFEIICPIVSVLFTLFNKFLLSQTNRNDTCNKRF